MPVTEAEVLAHMGIQEPLPGPDAEHLVVVVKAVNEMVPRTVPRIRAQPVPSRYSWEEPVEIVWPADVQQGAVMQAARLFSRRNSPTGVAAYTDSGPAYVARWDPDIERLLGIGSWHPPQVG